MKTKSIILLILLMPGMLSASYWQTYTNTTYTGADRVATADTACAAGTTGAVSDYWVEVDIGYWNYRCATTDPIWTSGQYNIIQYCDDGSQSTSAICPEDNQPCDTSQTTSVTGQGIPPSQYCDGVCTYALDNFVFTTEYDQATLIYPFVAWYSGLGVECTEATPIEEYIPVDPNCPIDTAIGCHDPDQTTNDDCYTYTGVNGDSTVCTTDNEDCVTINGELWCSDGIPDCGMLNGELVCVDPTDGVDPGEACVSDGATTVCIEEAPSEETTTTTETEILGDGTTIETTTTVSPDGNTTTTVTTTDPAGNVTSVTTEEGYDEPQFMPPEKGSFPIDEATAELNNKKAELSDWINEKQNQISQMLNVNITGTPNLPVYTFTAMGTTHTVDLNNAADFFSMVGIAVLLASTIISFMIVMRA
jgi:hypothetical protein